MNNVIINQYRNQISRGKEGFGVFDGLRVFKAAKEKRIYNWLGKKKNQKDFILFHHRYPTSTENRRKAAHPFHTGSYFGDTKYVLVHNGSINNDDELYEAHSKLGIEYSSVLEDLTYNDSEALLWDFALTMEGKQEELKAQGGIAFVAAKMVKDKMVEIYYARNYSKPLKVYQDSEGILISSEGQGEAVDTHKLYTYNYKTRKTTEKDFKVPVWSYTYSGNTSSNSYYYGSQGKLEKKDDNTPTRGESELGYINYKGEFVYWEEEREQRLISSPPLPISDPEAEQECRLFIAGIRGVSNEKMMEKLYEQYMATSGGDYEDCYWTMEADYIYFEGQAYNIYKSRVLNLIQGSMMVLMRNSYRDEEQTNKEFINSERILLNG